MENYLVWHNGKIVPRDELSEDPTGHSLNYGSSIFTGIRRYRKNNRNVFLCLREHINRLFDGAKLYRMPVSCDEISLVTALKTYAREMPDCNYFQMRLWWGTVEPSKKSGQPQHLGGVDPRTCRLNISIVGDDWQAYFGKDVYEKGGGVIVSSYLRPAPNVGNTLIKGGPNYGVAQLVKMAAREHYYCDVDGHLVPCVDGLMFSYDGCPSEATGACLFVVRHGRIITPPMKDGALDGITKRIVLRLAQLNDTEIFVESLFPSDIFIGEEVWLTGSAAEISPIVWVGGYRIGDGRPGPRFKMVRGWFTDYIDRVLNQDEDPLHIATVF